MGPAGCRRAARVATILAPLALAACANPTEVREAQIERDRILCEELGFEPGSENFALCTLLQDTNRRIDRVDQRMFLLESDFRRYDMFARRPFRYW